MSPAAVPGHVIRAFDAAVQGVRDLTPHFRRITFGGPALETFGVPGPTADLRIKLLLPTPGHPLDRLGTPGGELGGGWYQEWLRREQPGRGFIRSYTVRALRTVPGGRELDVDFVIHPVAAGHGAPASEWAGAATPGARVVIIGPEVNAITASTLRSETGIRWDPQGARRVLLAGDETAVPAISSILEDLPADISGHAFLEVPDTSDVGTVTTASAVCITWLARKPAGASRGELLNESVRAALDLTGRPDSVQPDPGLYAWVAAEAGTVKCLRRQLVNQAGLDPKRSEFRAYWSLGKAGSGANGTPLNPPPSPSSELGHTIGSF
ncbi:iron complex transport system ATP-binding protein [Arthrobacter pascens]|uniref:siderophore-interacting protein n=1 Tax=Arthrobacter pascens TaxID=1677 RepID=UPI0027948314|nr:siderophore-interacting protein [Arthrobacter pascens]MDQ0677281.1 iron complex transport system ATP-binding protein [Arthrobacter pascens]